MKALKLFTVVFTSITFCACNNSRNQSNQNVQTVVTDSVKEQLTSIDSLLQNKQFAIEMAQNQEAAYYKNANETVPAFLKSGEDTLLIEKSVWDEKIATNLAGFYALECGLNYLCSKDSTTPAYWIEKLTTGGMHDEKDAVEILIRFANATWKASQPFRSLDRIKKSNFIGWSGLSNDEVMKDYNQIKAAAFKLKPLIKGKKDVQLAQLKTLLQSKEFAASIAAHMDSSYYIGENKPVPPFLSAAEAAAKKKKSFMEEKVATNIAGLYALECGLNYFTKHTKQTPVTFLTSILDNSIDKTDKLLLCRFANATWKAGQPFRSLDRITRETFTPFNFLSEADIEKDWVQIKAAAQKLLQHLN